MKIISLNTWGGRLSDPLFRFIEQNTLLTDVFCFQEVLKGGSGLTMRSELKSGFEDIQAALPNHTGYFFEYGPGGYYGELLNGADFRYGIACFVNNTHKQSFGGGVTLYDTNQTWDDYSGRFAAGTSMAVIVEDYVVVNVHGLWQGSIKEDTGAKIEQSKKVIELAEAFEGKKIICGDFNVLPHTQSIKMLSDRYTNLIEQFKITDTRGALYTKDLRYSDYAFLDHRAKVRSFEVPHIEVSDHLPLIIETE